MKLVGPAASGADSRSGEAEMKVVSSEAGTVKLEGENSVTLGGVRTRSGDLFRF